MARKRVTVEAIAAMAPGDVLWDTELRRFGVRHRMRDRIYLVKARIKGRQRILTIGRDGEGAWKPQKARHEAKRLLGIIANGEDPAAERDQARKAQDLAAFAARYLAEYARPHKKVRTVTEDERLLRLHILPVLGNSKVRDIGRSDVARFHQAYSKPVAANRALALLSGILGWAEKVGERTDGSNPCRHIERYPEKPRERLLTAAELARLGDAWIAPHRVGRTSARRRGGTNANAKPTRRICCRQRGRPGSRRACQSVIRLKTGARLPRSDCSSSRVPG